MTNDMLDPNDRLDQTKARSATRRIPVVIATVVVGGLAGFAALYGLGLGRSPSGDPACRAAVNTAQKIAPLAHGEVAALAMATTPLKLPDLAFEDADGRPKKLSDFLGKKLLVNLLGTCGLPCRRCRSAAAAPPGTGATRTPLSLISDPPPGGTPGSPASWTTRWNASA